MHRIFQERPEILTPVFEVLEVPLSAKATVDAVTTDVTETRPLERRVDTVLRIGRSDGEDFLLAIEAQSDKKEAKAASWAYCIAYLQAKYRLPVLLLVVCQDRATAKWAVGPFECGTKRVDGPADVSARRRAGKPAGDHRHQNRGEEARAGRALRRGPRPQPCVRRHTGGDRQRPQPR
ncbi:hypothetical protein ACRAWF_07035 [Streptomyces sp. L7]